MKQIYVGLDLTEVIFILFVTRLCVLEKVNGIVYIESNSFISCGRGNELCNENDDYI
jgi:hypothetical protein